MGEVGMLVPYGQLAVWRDRTVVSRSSHNTQEGDLPTWSLSLDAG